MIAEDKTDTCHLCSECVFHCSLVQVILTLSFYSIAYIEFKTEAEAEKMLEEAQGADVQGRSIMVDYVGEKSQKGAKVSGEIFRRLILFA